MSAPRCTGARPSTPRCSGRRASMSSCAHDDEGSLGYYGARGFSELGRMQDVFLELATVEVAAERVPDGISIVAATPEHDRGAYEVALEADADIPSGEPIVSGPYRAVARAAFRRADDPRALVRRARRRSVVGYAILSRHTEGTGEHCDDGRRAQPPRARHRARAQGGADRGREGRGLPDAAHAERPRQRADAPRERETRLRAANSSGFTWAGRCSRADGSRRASRDDAVSVFPERSTRTCR